MYFALTVLMYCILLNTNDNMYNMYNKIYAKNINI